MEKGPIFLYHHKCASSVLIDSIVFLKIFLPVAERIDLFRSKRFRFGLDQEEQERKKDRDCIGLWLKFNKTRNKNIGIKIIERERKTLDEKALMNNNIHCVISKGCGEKWSIVYFGWKNL